LRVAGHDDWLLCQVTSNPYSDPQAIKVTAAEMAQGGLNTTSFVRPLKVFTANGNVIAKRVGILKPETFKVIIDALIHTLRNSIPRGE
jgi:mRNA interferase MazF